jgi:hypothetical protein
MHSEVDIAPPMVPNLNTEHHSTAAGVRNKPLQLCLICFEAQVGTSSPMTHKLSYQILVDTPFIIYHPLGTRKRRTAQDAIEVGVESTCEKSKLLGVCVARRGLSCRGEGYAFHSLRSAGSVDSVPPSDI